MRSMLVAILVVLGLAGCASDGTPRPTPSQITDAVVIAVQGASDTALDVVRIWEKNPGEGDDEAATIQRIALSVTAVGNMLKAQLQILEALGYIPTPGQQAAIDEAVYDFNNAATKVGAETVD